MIRDHQGGGRPPGCAMFQGMGGGGQRWGGWRARSLRRTPESREAHSTGAVGGMMSCARAYVLPSAPEGRAHRWDGSDVACWWFGACAGARGARAMPGARCVALDGRTLPQPNRPSSCFVKFIFLNQCDVHLVLLAVLVAAERDFGAEVVLSLLHCIAHTRHCQLG